MAVYGPVRHQKSIIWTSEVSVYIIFFWWRTGPYTAIWPSVPWTICYIYVNRCFSLEFWYRYFELTFFKILAFDIVIDIDEHNERIRHKERFIVLFMWNYILLLFKHCSSSRLWRKKRIQLFYDILSSVITQHVINLHQINCKTCVSKYNTIKNKIQAHYEKNIYGCLRKINFLQFKYDYVIFPVLLTCYN
jgi:hypothetical protein